MDDFISINTDTSISTNFEHINKNFKSLNASIHILNKKIDNLTKLVNSLSNTIENFQTSTERTINEAIRTKQPTRFVPAHTQSIKEFLTND